MSQEKQYKITVNKKQYMVKALPTTPLLWILREQLKLTGTKFSCGMGLCGSCTVHLNDKDIRSCSIQIGQLGPNSQITTIEGLVAEDPSHRVLEAWKKIDVPQCGYCQPGQIMKAVALYHGNPNQSAKTALKAMDNLCRCGTYPEIKEAVETIFSN